MVSSLRARGNRISFGTIFAIKHLYSTVMRVLNPDKRYECVRKFTPKRTAFENSKEIVTLPGAPVGWFRQQALASAKVAKDRYGGIGPKVAIEEPDCVPRLEVLTHTDSLETHSTRSTGDLPVEALRPTACDRQYRPKLKGHVRGSELHRHRPSAKSTAQSSGSILKWRRRRRTSLRPTTMTVPLFPRNPMARLFCPSATSAPLAKLLSVHPGRKMTRCANGCKVRRSCNKL